MQLSCINTKIAANAAFLLQQHYKSQTRHKISAKPNTIKAKGYKHR